MGSPPPERSDEPRHPIQVVARRTGLTPDLLRAWERRYGVVSPGRSAGSHRLYSDADIERLNLVRQALAGGRRIHHVARLDAAELRALLDEDRAARDAAPGDPRRRPPAVAAGALETPHEEVAALLEAVRALDQARLESLLEEAALRAPLPLLVDQVLAPLFDEIGREWACGTLRVANEHLASAAVRSFLGGQRVAQPAPAGAPEIIVGTPAGQLHELGALSVALVAQADGWLVTYLGPNVPAEDLGAAARQRAPRAVALSITYPPDDPQVARELARLRRVLPPAVAIIAGGLAAPAYDKTLQEIGAILADGLPDLRRQLESLRQPR